MADGNSSETTVTSYGSGVVEKVGDSNTDKFNFKSEWDGVSVAEATPTDGKIYTAAQLAYYQSKEIPKTTTGKDLPATMTGNVTLCADIDMKQQPWIGMVLGENAVLMAQIIPSLIYGWIILYFRSRVNILPMPV